MLDPELIRYDLSNKSEFMTRMYAKIQDVTDAELVGMGFVDYPARILHTPDVNKETVEDLERCWLYTHPECPDTYYIFSQPLDGGMWYQGFVQCPEDKLGNQLDKYSALSKNLGYGDLLCLGYVAE